MRNSLRLLRQIGSKSADWFEPSKDSAARWKAIPLIDEVGRRSRPRHGRIAYDSWSEVSVIPLRNVTDGHIRRLELKGGGVTLEIVAERLQDHWEFVGRIYAGSEVRHDYVLRIGRLKLLPQTDGFYHWSSHGVPRSIAALSYKNNLQFGGITW